MYQSQIGKSSDPEAEATGYMADLDISAAEKILTRSVCQPKIGCIVELAICRNHFGPQTHTRATDRRRRISHHIAPQRGIDFHHCDHMQERAQMARRLGFELRDNRPAPDAEDRPLSADPERL